MPRADGGGGMREGPAPPGRGGMLTGRGGTLTGAGVAVAGGASEAVVALRSFSSPMPQARLYPELLYSRTIS
jgi:hypothetical protein